MPKKLKVVVKSLYSHEIRKDVSLEELKNLKLEDAWPFIREEIEAEIGSNQLVCIPHVTEAELYAVTSLFVQKPNDAQGKLTPLGPLLESVDRGRSSAELVEWLERDNFQDPTFKFPHESVKITLQDESIKNKVRVIMVNLTRAAVPQDRKLTEDIYLDINKHPELKEARRVYIITSVLLVGTLEFRVTSGTCSRIFHLGTPTPLVFSLDQFRVGDDGRLLAKEPVSKCAGVRWQRMDSADQLYTSDKENAALYQ